MASVSPKVTRRRLLEMAGHASMLYYPLLRVLENSEAKAATGIVPRALMFTYSCGSYPEWWPAGGTGPLGNLSNILSPLQAHKDDLIVFKGVCQRGDTNHDAAPAQVFAGWGKKGAGNIPYPHRETSTPTPYSLDQMLGDKWVDSSVKKTVVLGSGSTFPALFNTTCFSKSGSPVQSQDNPAAAFDNIFGGFSLTNGGSGALALAQENIAYGRKRIIDYLRNDLSKIASSLGDMEKKQFESHVQHLDALALELSKLKPVVPPTPNSSPTMTPNGTPMPQMPSMTPAGNPVRSAQCNPSSAKGGIPADKMQLQTVMKANMQILLQALACGITRVGVHVFAVSDTTLDYGNGGNYHLASHANAGLANAQKNFIQNIADLAAGMKNVKIGDHTLYDECLMFCTTDQGDNPNNHDAMNIASFFLGNLGGKMKGNRMISWPYTPGDWMTKNNGMAFNKILVTYAHALGETSINEVGNTAFTGPIPEILNG